MKVERSWWWNQLAATGASFIGHTGFTLVMPFLPIYIRDLGETDVRLIALWAGLSLGITPAITAIVSPFWGRVADRVGRKLMVERALVSFVVIMTAMALVTRPWQILVLRAVQGFFAGYGALSLAMAAESAPKSRLAEAVGMVQTAQRLGPALGPVIGGTLAGLFGLRPVFFITAGVYLVALLVVVAVYREVPRPASAGTEEHRGARLADLTRLPGIPLMLVVIFIVQFVDRSFGPILPLHVPQLGVSPASVAVTSGVLFSVLACAAAAGNYVTAWLLARAAARRVLPIVVGGSAAAIVAVLLARDAWTLGAALAVFGLATGIGMTTAFTAAGSVVPDGAHGALYGTLSSASLAGTALSPAVSGLLAGLSLRGVFVLDAALLVLLGAFLQRASRLECRV